MDDLFRAVELERPILPDCAALLDLAANNQKMWYTLVWKLAPVSWAAGYYLAYCYVTN